MSEWRKVKIGDFLKRHKAPVDVRDNLVYKRVTIKTRHQGISVRDEQIGKKIGTKKQFTIKGGQFLLSKIDARYGAFGIVSDEVDGAIITGNFWAYDVDKNIVNIEWFNQFTNSNGFYDLCERSSSGITHRKYLDEKKFLNFELSIPNIDEQKNIVERNNLLKNKYNKLQTQNTFQQSNLFLLRQQILQDAISGNLTTDWRAANPNVEPASKLLEQIKAEKEKLIIENKIKKEKPLERIAEDEVPFGLPEGWEWCRLGEVCTKVTDGFHHTPPKKKEGKIYISATHIKDDGIRWDECLFIPEKEHGELFKKAFPQKGEILITNRGAGCGTPAIIDINEEFSFQNAALIGFNQEMISNKFVYYFILKSRPEIMAKFVNGGLQPMLSNVILRTIPFSLPPRAEQRAIVAKVERLMEYVAQLEEKIANNANNAEILMQVFLSEAFSN